MADKRCCPICGFDYGILWVLIKTSSKFNRTGNRCKKCDAVLTIKGESASYANKIKIVLIIAIGFYGFFFHQCILLLADLIYCSFFLYCFY